MWAMTVVAIIIALGGYYRLADKEGMAAAEQAKADHLAESMAIYREAVITYFTQHPGDFGTVTIDTLKSTNALPSWSTLTQYWATSIWTHYRHDNGVIYIYATKLPAVNIEADIVELAQNSLLAGVFRAGDTTLYSPIYGDTKVTLPPPSKAAIPNGSPVWIAMRR